MGNLGKAEKPGRADDEGFVDGPSLGDAIRFFLGAKRAGGRSGRTVSEYRKKLDLFQRGREAPCRRRDGGHARLVSGARRGGGVRGPHEGAQVLLIERQSPGPRALPAGLVVVKLSSKGPGRASGPFYCATICLQIAVFRESRRADSNR